MQSAVADVQKAILSPLSPADQALFMRLLTQFVAGHEAA
jgi:hypothetical protein